MGPYIAPQPVAGGANAANEDTFIILPLFLESISFKKSLVRWITEIPSTLKKLSSSSSSVE